MVKEEVISIEVIYRTKAGLRSKTAFCHSFNDEPIDLRKLLDNLRKEKDEVCEVRIPLKYISKEERKQFYELES